MAQREMKMSFPLVLFVIPACLESFFRFRTSRKDAGQASMTKRGDYQMKQFIKFLSITVIAFLFLTATAFAEKVTFVKEYNYNASDLDSKVSSRAIALEQVKRLLLEELGTYLISETEVKNFRLTKDQVTTYSAGVVSAEVVDEKWDGKTYYLKAKVSADPAEVTKSLKNIVNDKQKSKELEDIRKKASEFSKEIERLNKEMAIVKANSKKPEQEKIKQYNEAVKGLSAVDWLEKGKSFLNAKKYDDAIKAYDKAIELDPEPDNAAGAYFGRGVVYNMKGQLDRAIEDFNKAIELYPDYAHVYVSRGYVYSRKGQYDKAIMNFNKAIELYPDYANTYFGRGLAYYMKGQYDRAILDYNKTIELDPNDAVAYYTRGATYDMKGQYDRAIIDYTNAIQLNPQYTEAYNNRGIAYAHLGDAQKALENLKIAAKLGNKAAQEFLRTSGIDW